MVKLDTCCRKQAHEALIATMNPELRAYLNRINNDITLHADKMNNDIAPILKALVAQTARIDAETESRSPLRQARSVSALQTTLP